VIGERQLSRGISAGQVSSSRPTPSLTGPLEPTNLYGPGDNFISADIARAACIAYERFTMRKGLGLSEV